MSEVRVETTDRIMTVTLADVDNRNALGAAVVNGMHDAITQANATQDIRAVVITNDGNTFCAGANLKEQSGASQGSRPKVGFEALLAQIQTSPTPIIGKINGHVVGGGNGLAAALDVAIAREDVKFGFTEVRLGVVPAIISVVCLPKMRRGDAMEMFLRGSRFPAAKAAEFGLIARAVPGDELDAAVDEVLDDLRLGGPNALEHAKRLVNEVPKFSQEEAFAWTSELSARLFKSDEAAAGMRAFLKREPPPWAKDSE
ncbi:enoyl-CoA hydratase-related protein [Myxococcota bacterium]|nr:enoyl-CoA hydratase-related protein [Myxococcota bacterium]